MREQRCARYGMSGVDQATRVQHRKPSPSMTLAMAVLLCTPVLCLWCGPALAATDAEAWSRYQQICQEEIHMRCVRQGIKWLARNDLSARRKAQIYGYLAVAYTALNRRSQAKQALIQMVELAPCRSQPPPALPSTLHDLFHSTRRAVLRQDQVAPVISHKPPTTRQFRDVGLFTAKISENLGLRPGQPLLYYRLQGSGAYTSILMQPIGQDTFQVRLSARIRQRAQTFQYYLEATDCAANVGTAQSSSQPFVIVEQAQGASGRTVGGAILLALGSALVVSSPITFLSANSELERWKATQDIPRSEEIRSNIILLHGLGWGGLGLGLVVAAVGTYLVLTPSSKRVSPKVRALSLHPLDPNEADYATMVRIPNFSNRSPAPARK